MENLCIYYYVSIISGSVNILVQKSEMDLAGLMATAIAASLPYIVKQTESICKLMEIFENIGPRESHLYFILATSS